MNADNIHEERNVSEQYSIQYLICELLLLLKKSVKCVFLLISI